MAEALPLAVSTGVSGSGSGKPPTDISSPQKQEPQLPRTLKSLARYDLDNDLLRRYSSLTLDEVPSFAANDSRVEEYIKARKPVVITETELVSSALHWNLNYLAEHFGEGKCNVYISDTDNFKYYDEKKVGNVKGFRKPMELKEMTFREFVSCLKVPNKTKRYYLQQALNEGVGKNIVYDFVRFNWNWPNSMQAKMGWGDLTSNLMLIGEPGNITPLHFDEQQNFFSQLRGYKRFILYPPTQFECVYPHPIFHPCDRQCQVTLDNPDLERFPKFAKAKGYQVVVGPGDVLYLPTYWFHQVESLDRGKDDDHTISITFWFKPAPVGDIKYPLKAHQKLSMMRNLEKMICEALNDPAEVPSFLESMVLGRYTKDVVSKKS